MIYSDKQLLDELSNLDHGYGHGWICRSSTNGRGLRLHETSRDGTSLTPREAIAEYLQQKRIPHKMDGDSK